ncbi:hypothetical protein EYD10_17670 [Varanus komodoensis]|uniref:protein MRP-126-like n=1 Tax=Varanus komodoensis TaxID=61221 RepID=UPI001CF78CF0|nr:protein MRP-126-like [Varanus komodoensis]KAF7235497.1 hypothetical protein EYD10_17670 [Varanus komodoensis]
MSPLETALDTVINVFHQYSTHKPHPDKLNNGELKQLIEKELAEFLKNQVNPTSIEEMFKHLDQNKDQEISFKEFMVMIGQVTEATHEKLHTE